MKEPAASARRRIAPHVEPQLKDGIAITRPTYTVWITEPGKATLKQHLTAGPLHNKRAAVRLLHQLLHIMQGGALSAVAAKQLKRVDGEVRVTFPTPGAAIAGQTTTRLHYQCHINTTGNIIVEEL
jgi:hypothetical protein